MKRILSLALIILLWPTFSFAGRHDHPQRYGNEPYGYYRQSPPYSGERHHGYHSPGPNHHHNDWILPLAIVGTALGVMALSQQYPPPPPPPPQRMCRDTYNHYDQYGRYTYSEYVDRPCND
jgi:hypothetical protein